MFICSPDTTAGRNRGNGGINPHILNLGSRCEWSVSRLGCFTRGGREFLR